jgi:hypothetical protein
MSQIRHKTETKASKHVGFIKYLIEIILNSKDFWISRLVIPVILIFVFSASMLVVFRSTINFMNHQQVAIDTLKQGHQKSADFLVELRFLRSRIAYWEADGQGVGWEPYQDIKELHKELEQIQAIGQAFDSECFTAAQIAINSLNNYRKCLKNRSATCSKQFELKPFKELINYYSKAIRNTVR